MATAAPNPVHGASATPTPTREQPVPEPGCTGRYLVVFRQRPKTQEALSVLSNILGINHVASGSDYGSQAANAVGLYSAATTAVPRLPIEDPVYFERSGIAVISAELSDPAAISASSVGEDSVIFEKERWVYGDVSTPLRPTSNAGEGNFGDYLRGYRDAAIDIYERFQNGLASTGLTTGSTFDQSRYTWGLQTTRAAISRYTGRGIKLAILDTGFDLNHADFRERQVTSRSFVTGELVQDGNGHGTHCVGTACGPRDPRTLPGYGIASEAEIYVGKVLDNTGRGKDGDVIAGIEWAIGQECSIISMSLCAAVRENEPHSPAYERVAQVAMEKRALIFAAAGNDSSRPGVILPVSRPANCPSIYAVGAVDTFLNVASFSNGGLNPNGGQVDIAAPGVRVRSSWPGGYNVEDGTSMATPHVAGIAALYAEAQPNLRGRDLAQAVFHRVQPMRLPSRDVGAGFVQAP